MQVIISSPVELPYIGSANTWLGRWPIGITYASNAIGTALRGFILSPRGISLYLAGFALWSVGIVLAKKGITTLSSANGTLKPGLGYAKMTTAQGYTC